MKIIPAMIELQELKRVESKTFGKEIHRWFHSGIDAEITVKES